MLRQLADSSQVTERVADYGISWHFNPTAVPYFKGGGGLWEAAIKSVKRDLFRAMPSRVFSRSEPSLLLIKIEGCINSRPIYSAVSFHFFAFRTGAVSPLFLVVWVLPLLSSCRPCPPCSTHAPTKFVAIRFAASIRSKSNSQIFYDNVCGLMSLPCIIIIDVAKGCVGVSHPPSTFFTCRHFRKFHRDPAMEKK